MLFLTKFHATYVCAVLKYVTFLPKWSHLNIILTQQNILNQPIAATIRSLFREDLFLFRRSPQNPGKIMAFCTENLFFGRGDRPQRQDVAPTNFRLPPPKKKFRSGYVPDNKY